MILKFSEFSRRNILTLLCTLFCTTLIAQQRYYINGAATGTNTGTSWANAFTTISAAYTKVTAGDTLWIAKGTYLSTTNTDRLKSMSFQDGVKVYGGFNGDETVLSQRDWANNQTVLSGDIGVPGDNSDNSYHVLKVSGQIAGLVLDGLVITGGNCKNQVSVPIGQPGFDSNSGYGAGIVSSSRESITFRNCVISDNMAKNGAGFSGTRSESSFYNCVFTRNDAFDNGGAFYNAFSGNVKFFDCDFIENVARNGSAIDHASNPETTKSLTTILNCNFIRNTAYSNGGAVRFAEGTVTGSVFESNNANMGGAISTRSSTSDGARVIRHSRFRKNKATGMGGAIHSNCSLDVFNSVFFGNEAAGSGGGAITHQSNSGFTVRSLRILNSTIINNKCGGTGSAVYIGSTVDYAYNVSVTNCIIWDNDARGRIVNTHYYEQISPKGGRYTRDEVRVNYCLTNGGEASGNSATNTNSDANPGLDTTSVSYWQLHDGSAAINAGTPDTTGLVLGQFDIVLNNRMQNGRVDVGAYEFQESFVPAIAVAVRSEDNRSAVTLQDTLQLYADFTPANTTNRGVKWKIVNGFSVGYVDSEGRLYSTDKTTTGTIRVRAVSVYDAAVWGEKEFTFYQPVSSITLSTENTITEITEGDTLQLLADVLPANATTKTLIWEILEGSRIASINNEGLLVTTGAGEVVVRATATDGSGISDTYEVSVLKAMVPVTEIVLSTEGNITEISGTQTLQINANVLPDDATDKALSWEIVQGAECASVSPSGIVTISCVGSVVVKATASDGSEISAQYQLEAIEEVITSIPEAGSSGFTFYPNPTDGNVYIRTAQLSGAGWDIEVVDGKGTAVHRSYASGDAYDLQLALPSGIYMLRIRKGEQHLNEKLIVR
jgi:uncharacterized protein YjdB